MEIVKFSEFSASELTRLWNEGFKGYAFDMTMSVDAFIKRIPENQLSMEASIAICDQGKPVGFVMNGFRTVDGRLTAWNGGTGIIPEYRGRGLGKQLIGAALDVCREKGAEVALLEALSENEPAIKLYAKMGYRWIGDLRFYEQKEGLKPDALASEGEDAYQFRFGLPRDVQRFNLPVGDLPWQTHWENIAGGESVIATDANGELAGYALFRKTMDAGGEHQATILYQCRTVEDTGERAPELLKALLSRAYAPLDANITRRAVNLRVSEERLIRVLEEAGFNATVHQVHMKCELNQA